ncbi:MAG: hydrogenase subunit MbhD domain-containing protein [Ignisphaera sp.]
MLELADLVFVMLGISALLSIPATILAIISRDLLRAVIFSALQSTMYTLMFFLLMAPDIVLVYVAVSIGFMSLLIILLIKKVGRYERY